MKWQILLNSREAIIDLPNRIVDGEWFEATIDGKVYNVRWNRAAQLLALANPETPMLEQHIRARFLNIEKDPEEAESTAYIEATKYDSSKTLSLEAKVELSVPGLKNRKASAANSSAVIKSPMAGKVLKVLVKVGDSVAKGETVAIIEAMKMENKISATTTGIVEELFVQEGHQATVKEKLCSIKPNTPN